MPKSSASKSSKNKSVETLKHDEATRKNIPTAEHQSVMAEEEKSPIRVAYERRNRDLDPQLVWRGKDEQDWSDLVVSAPPLYIQEKVHPKVLVDDLLRRSQERTEATLDAQLDLFADFNGLPKDATATEFYQHDAHWTNRMILGDSLQVMASLAEREGLRGKVQCIYIDPPYGIKFNSNFQWSTTSRDVKDGNVTHITREPEQVKAFRDTWRDGIHSYLTYLRDRLTVARDLLTDSGSIFVQIGDENLHIVRALIDEVFGTGNFVSLITYAKTTGFSGNYLSSVSDYIIWYCKDFNLLKYRTLNILKEAGEEGASKYRQASTIKALENYPINFERLATSDQLTSQGTSANSNQSFNFKEKIWQPPPGLHWKTTVTGLERLAKAHRVIQEGRSVRYVRYLDDLAVYPQTNIWLDIGGVQSRYDPKIYVVQTATEAIKRCTLMTTDPGDLVLDPTCLRKGTRIVTECGLKPIEKIEVGEKVLTHTGQFKPVLKAMKRDYCGKMVGIKRKGHHQTLWLTADHPVLAVRTKDCFDGRVCHAIPECRLHKRGLYLTCSNPKQDYQEEWIPAGELKADDYVICDAPIDSVDKTFSPELAYLLGLYLAEGFCDQYSLCFCFHENEDHLIEAVRTLLPKIFGCQPGKRFNEKDTGKAYKIRFHSRTAVEFFRQFGYRATEKYLPDWILQCNPQAQAEIIRGWFEGDGNIYRDGFRAGSVSPSLADGMSRLLWRQGIVATVGKTDAHTRPHAYASKHDVVTVSVHGRYILQMAQIMQVEFNYDGRRQHDRVGWIHNKHRLWAKIESIQHERKHEVVYNLTVEDDHSFVTEVCTVHNCGSGTTAYVSEQWGRRWITIDTSRVALALARARIMGARYPYYLLADSPAGQQKEAEVSRTMPSTAPTYGNIRQGFVYERVPHITLKSIANNAEIDVIWEKFQEKLEPLREALNAELGKTWEEWEIPREADPKWPEQAKDLHSQWWQHRIARQKEIDASIAAKADQEFLYDKPYEDKNIVRVAGPFTVESLSPHRVLAVDENDELIDPNLTNPERSTNEADFANVILENLKTAGVQQAHKEDKITFTTLTGWPGNYICAEGRYLEGESEQEKRAGIFIGPEFGTVSRSDLVAAAREAGDAGFDVLITCAFNYDAHSADFTKLGRIPVLKARMNADLHMAGELKNTGAGNLFVIFGEPDIDINAVEGGRIQVKIHGVDVFHPQSGDVRSSNTDEIACWFIDTDYNEESFFVRHAYFLGASDPYKSLKTTLKAEIDEEAWESLYSDTSRPFEKPKSGRIAVKVINHLGDEVMKVFSVE